MNVPEKSILNNGSHIVYQIDIRDLKDLGYVFSSIISEGHYQILKNNNKTVSELKYY